MSYFVPYTLNLRGRLLTIDRPQVMGIVNVTPDSFYSGSRVADTDAVCSMVERMITDGADMIDVGGYSTRPGASEVTVDEELRRVEIGITAIRRIDPDIPVSVDTFRPEVASRSVKILGADIVNDVYGSHPQDGMIETVAELHVPYILMHSRGDSTNMSTLTDYAKEGVVVGLCREISAVLDRLELLGVADIIIDPGFGFAKTVEQNYCLLDHLADIGRILKRPILAGLSRKSMLWRPLSITPDEALEATTAANVLALERGASILRVHDVKAASQAIAVTSMTHGSSVADHRPI